MQGYSSNLGVKQIKYINFWSEIIMKRLVKQRIQSASNFADTKVVFTPEEIVNLLSQIDELKEHRIKVINDSDGLRFVIGDYEYQI